MIAASLAAVPGASAVLERGFVTYSNEAKTEMLGVPAALIDAHGAVSQEVALAMVEGALAHSRADIAVAVTGIAGPDGGSEAEAGGARAHRGGAGAAARVCTKRSASAISGVTRFRRESACSRRWRWYSGCLD